MANAIGLRPIDLLLDAFGYDGPRGRRKYQCLCPAHDYKKPTLSVTECDDGKVLLYCHGGCTADQVLKARGLTFADLDPIAGNGRAKPKPRPQSAKIVATYDYPDETGTVRHQTVRFDPKEFKQRRPDGMGGWIWDLKGIEPVLYGLLRLLATPIDQLVFIAEGEKDCDRLNALGLVAVTNAMGAGKWDAGYSGYFVNRRVCILVDNDVYGRDHARTVFENLQGIASEVCMLSLPDLPEKGDVSDWLNRGGMAEQLLALAELAISEAQAEVVSVVYQTRWTADDLTVASFPDPVWIVEGIVPSGLSTLAGRPKIGKSLLVLQVAIAVACGGMVFGKKVEARRVLYLALEDGPRRLKERLAAMHYSPGATLAFYTEWPNLLRGGYERLIDEIMQGDYAFTIIDTASRFYGVRKLEDENRAAELLGQLQRYLLENNRSCLQVAHHRKGAGSVSDVIDDVMGTTAFTAVLDAAMGLYRPRGQIDAELRIVGRDMADQELALRLDHDLGFWSFVGEAGKVRSDSVQGQIVKVLSSEFDRDKGATVPEIAIAVDRHRENVRKEIAELVANGELIQEGEQGRHKLFKLALVSAVSDKSDKSDKSDVSDRYAGKK